MFICVCAIQFEKQELLCVNITLKYFKASLFFYSVYAPFNLCKPTIGMNAIVYTNKNKQNIAVHGFVLISNS